MTQWRRQEADLHGPKPSQQIGTVALLTHIQHHHLTATVLRQMLHDRCLPCACLSHQQHGLVLRDGVGDVLQ